MHAAICTLLYACIQINFAVTCRDNLLYIVVVLYEFTNR